MQETQGRFASVGFARLSNPQFPLRSKVRILNTVDSSLIMLMKKGNLSYVNEIYNPNDFFAEVHHISLYPEDSRIKLENKTIKVHVLKSVIGKPLWHPMNVLLFLIQFIRIARTHRVSMIRARSTNLSGFLAVLTGKILGIPCVVSLGQDTKLLRELKANFRRGNPSRLETVKETLIELVELFIVRKADFIITPSEHLKDYAVSLRADIDKIRVVPWVLKRDFFTGKIDKKELRAFVTKSSLDLKKPIVLFVGRLDIEKQVDVLVEAVPFILQEKPDVQFVFLGDGPLKEKLKERITSLEAGGSVYFFGFQPTNVVEAFLSMASVVWIPMSGYVVFEAAAFRAPIVAFNVEWHHEFVSDRITGLLVENRNVRKMAEAVIELLDNPDLARKCGEGAWRKLMKEYNPETLKEKEIEIYKMILHQY